MIHGVCPAGGVVCGRAPELAAVLGHTAVTHRAIGLLAGEGITTPAAVRAATNEDLLDIRNLGWGALLTIREHFPHIPSDPSTPKEHPVAESTPFTGWVILELLGHRRLAGFLTEQQIAGTSFLRIDIPATPPMTQFVAPTSVYAITPTSEGIARTVAGGSSPAPVQRWELESVRGRIEDGEPF
jgi:hypothetical protein